LLEAYRAHIQERHSLGIPPKPLSPEWTSQLTELLKNPPAGEEDYLIDLITNRVPPGVDESAYVKAGFLTAIAQGETICPIISREQSVILLGQMHGGYNVATLINLLDDNQLAELAAEQLKSTLLIFDAFHDVASKADLGNSYAAEVIRSWANAEWFTSKTPLPESVKAVVFKCVGETNTDDLSPAQDAWSRPDIPLHARAMYKMPRDGLNPDEPGKTGPLLQIQEILNKRLECPTSDQVESA
jgi:aconitate hydratase 2/2-methylisocitrate dehydratase